MSDDALEGVEKLGKPDELKGQPCPFCHTDNLSLMQENVDVPFFGKTLIFSMSCTNCKYHKADVEAEENKGKVKQEIEISSEDDMSIRVIKSSDATIKIPRVVTISPGPSSQGYITNVEGIIRRVMHQVESAKDNADEDSERKKAKNLLKKLQKVIWGQEKLKISLDDPSGNSAIISDKVQKK